MNAQKSGTPINLALSGIVSKQGGNLLGFYVNSTNAGTVVIRNGITASDTAVTGTITPAAGRFHKLPIDLQSGCFADIGGTALDVTFFFAAG